MLWTGGACANTRKTNTIQQVPKHKACVGRQILAKARCSVVVWETTSVASGSSFLLGFGFVTGPEAPIAHKVFSPSWPNSKLGIIPQANGPVSEVSVSKKVGSGFLVLP